MIFQIRYDVKGPNGPALEKAATDVLTEFVESPELWRIGIEAHETDSEWVGHVTVRRKRQRTDDDEYF